MSARATTRDELCRSNLAGPTRRLVDIKCNGQRKVHFMGAGTRERDAVRAVREGTRGVTVEARWFARGRRAYDYNASSERTRHQSVWSSKGDGAADAGAASEGPAPACGIGPGVGASTPISFRIFIARF